jgi:hypothetical protein
MGNNEGVALGWILWPFQGQERVAGYARLKCQALR